MIKVLNLQAFFSRNKKKLISFYKILVLLSVASLFFFLCQMLATSIFGGFPGETFAVLMSHKEASHNLGWATLLHIVLIKIGVAVKGGATHDLVFYIHLVFAFLFAFLAAIFFFMYEETGGYHGFLTILTFISFTVVASIGVPMLSRRF